MSFHSSSNFANAETSRFENLDFIGIAALRHELFSKDIGHEIEADVPSLNATAAVLAAIRRYPINLVSHLRYSLLVGEVIQVLVIASLSSTKRGFASFITDFKILSVCD